MTDVVQILWGYCDYLRHDGMSYGNYIEQLSYLLFLKMANEKEIKLPKKCDWDELNSKSGTVLLDKYIEILQKLGKEKGILGDIFGKSHSAFNEPTNLKKLLTEMNNTNFSSLGVDVKSKLYEGLLEKYAANEKGAGQYFTPRTLIDSIMKCVQPDFDKSGYKIHDPACGTCGFLISAFEWIMKLTDDGSKLKDPDKIRLVKSTFSGMDNVFSTRRLGLMNCFLHEIEPDLTFGNSLADGYHAKQQYDLVLTNPPFGSSGAGGIPTRPDFLYPTSNKQLNFVQHVLTILKPTGKCAMVVPDGVLFGDEGQSLREDLLKQCDLHTILILPEGTFVPYANAKANVIFFTKGKSTKDVWIYDLRTNIPKIRKKNPLDEKLFDDFIKCYFQKNRQQTERFEKRTLKQIKENKFNLFFKFIKDKNLIDLDDLPEPDILANKISEKLQLATKSINELITTLNKK